MNEVGETADETRTLSSQDHPMLGGWGLSVVCGCDKVSAAMLAVGDGNSHKSKGTQAYMVIL